MRLGCEFTQADRGTPSADNILSFNSLLPIAMVLIDLSVFFWKLTTKAGSADNLIILWMRQGYEASSKYQIRVDQNCY